MEALLHKELAKTTLVTSLAGEENFARSRSSSGFSVPGRAKEVNSVGTTFSLAREAACAAED